jgi:2'-5' RNA ligase
MNEKHLLLVAIMPDDPTTEIIEQIRQDFANKYNCKAALKPLIHITLIPPFYIEGPGTERVESLLAGSVTGMPSFTVRLRNYGTFPKNRVVFIDIEQAPELLELQANIQKIMSTEYGVAIKLQPRFHPHITIGRKDIPRSLYPAAAAEYSSKRIAHSFHCSKVALLKHDGSNWRVHSIYGLQET